MSSVYVLYPICYVMCMSYVLCSISYVLCAVMCMVYVLCLLCSMFYILYPMPYVYVLCPISYALCLCVLCLCPDSGAKPSLKACILSTCLRRVLNMELLPPLRRQLLRPTTHVNVPSHTSERERTKHTFHYPAWSVQLWWADGWSRRHAVHHVSGDICI